jgi:predicted protein tyrosine phosphatase
MVIAMFDELDSELAGVFAKAREPFGDDAFVAQLLLKIERAQRARLWRRMAAIVAAMIILVLVTPLMLEKTATLVRIVGDNSPSFTELLITPGGWAASMLVGAWVVFRSRLSRR